MAAEYRVDRFPKVTEQVKSLAAKAKDLGSLKRFVSALKEIVVNLQTRPLEWGDPLYRTKKAGGIVKCGILTPLVVHYAVYEAERVVQIIDLKPLPKSELDEA
jgi:hypothetical protein